MTDEPPELSIILFAYNEAENIGAVIAELDEWLQRQSIVTEVIFVDDGSADGTHDRAARALDSLRGTVLRHEQNSGIGAAIKTGVRAATGRWVTFLPCDGQIPPSAIGTLLDARDSSTQAVFSVYDHRDDGLHRTLLSFGVRSLITLVHGVHMRSDGPYLFRRQLFDPEQLEPDTFFLNFEFPIRAIAAGLGHRIVTIPCRPRRAGYSKSTGLSRIAGVGRDLFALRVRLLRDFARRTTGR